VRSVPGPGSLAGIHPADGIEDEVRLGGSQLSEVGRDDPPFAIAEHGEGKADGRDAEGGGRIECLLLPISSG